MDLVAGVKKIIVVMEHNSKVGAPKFVPTCTLPLTGKNVVDMIITDLAVFKCDDHASPFKLIERAPGVRWNEVAPKTTAKYQVNLIDNTSRDRVEIPRMGFPYHILLK